MSRFGAQPHARRGLLCWSRSSSSDVHVILPIRIFFFFFFFFFWVFSSPLFLCFFVFCLFFVCSPSGGVPPFCGGGGSPSPFCFLGFCCVFLGGGCVVGVWWVFVCVSVPLLSPLCCLLLWCCCFVGGWVLGGVFRPLCVVAPGGGLVWRWGWCGGLVMGVFLWFGVVFRGLGVGGGGFLVCVFVLVGGGGGGGGVCGGPPPLFLPVLLLCVVGIGGGGAPPPLFFWWVVVGGVVCPWCFLLLFWGWGGLLVCLFVPVEGFGLFFWGGGGGPPLGGVGFVVFVFVVFVVCLVFLGVPHARGRHRLPAGWPMFRRRLRCRFLCVMTSMMLAFRAGGFGDGAVDRFLVISRFFHRQLRLIFVAAIRSASL